MHLRDAADFVITPKTDGLFVFHVADRAGNDVDDTDVTAAVYRPTGQLIDAAVTCAFLVSGEYGIPIDAAWSQTATVPPKEITGLFYADVTVAVGPETLSDRIYWMVTY